KSCHIFWRDSMKNAMLWMLQFVQEGLPLYRYFTIVLPALLILFLILNSGTTFEAHAAMLNAQVAKAVIPAGNWMDTSGQSLQAHGAGIIQVGQTYYWFGENKAQNNWL